MSVEQLIDCVPRITRLKTSDVDELAEISQEWDQEYLQLKKGRFEWELNLIQIGDFQLLEEFHGAPTLVRGSAPADSLSIAIPTFTQGEALYGGNPIHENCCLLGSPKGFLDLRSDKTIRMLIIVAPIAQILARAEQMQCPLTQEYLSSPSLLTAHPKALKQLSAYVEEALRLAKTHPEQLTDPSKAGSMARLILEDLPPLLLDVLTTSVKSLPEKTSSRRKLIKQADAFMRDRIAAPITLSELCQAMQTSQRSLYYAFEECLGLPPMDYLKLLRLQSVRRALKSAEPETYKVYEIAGRWGFWHMGQLSRDYKAMFGETPSTTLKRN